MLKITVVHFYEFVPNRVPQLRDADVTGSLFLQNSISVSAQKIQTN
jgi:hypothetical protein